MPSCILRPTRPRRKRGGPKRRPKSGRPKSGQRAVEGRGGGITGQTTVRSRVDLHCHTTASDGSLAPEVLVAQAAELGIKVLAITDHDTIDGLSAAQEEAQRWEITVVPGVEISTLSGREEIHLLGYFVDPDEPELRALLARTREARRKRARQMLERLEGLGMPLAWERLLELAGEGSVIGRPHVAMSLLEAGHVSSWDEAFERWIGRGRPAYVERYKLAPEEAVRLVRRAGGLPVLAHPYIYSRNGEKKADMDLKHWLPRLQRAGLAGIEVYYPNYPRRVRRRLLELAAGRGLAVTGGSDFHGGPVGSGLGRVVVPWAAWESLERRHQLMRAGST